VEYIKHEEERAELFWLSITISIITGFMVTLTLTPHLIRAFKRRNIVGVDVHKLEKPLIPEMGGLAIIAGIACSVFVMMMLNHSIIVQLAVLLATVLVAGLIGTIDYLRVLPAKLKTALTVACFIPIVIAYLLFPSSISLGRPQLPMVGRLRLTIIYWVLLPFAIAVPANAVNMMDTFNGVMPGTCLAASLALLAASIITGKPEAASMSAVLIGPLLAYYYYNRFPARVFSGDTGSLAVGAAIGAIAIIGGLEVVAVVTLFPHIMNAFHSLTSIGGLVERRMLKVRPTLLLPDGRIAANNDPKAPLTLARIILLKGPLTEKELVKAHLQLSGVAAVLAVLTAILMTVKI